MEKKLYRVKVILYVMAENESEACLAATNAHFDIFECAARQAKYVDPEWNNAIPYNNQDYRTCAEILGDSQKVNNLMNQSPTEADRRLPRIQTQSNYSEAQTNPG